MLMIIQQIDCLKIEIQCFVAVRTYGAYGHAQFAQNHLVAFDAFVILQRLRTDIVVTAIEWELNGLSYHIPHAY